MQLSEALVRLEARVAARKGAGGVITRVRMRRFARNYFQTLSAVPVQVRNGLEWATPFMLGVVYLIILYRFFTRRRR